MGSGNFALGCRLPGFDSVSTWTQVCSTCFLSLWSSSYLGACPSCQRSIKGCFIPSTGSSLAKVTSRKYDPSLVGEIAKTHEGCKGKIQTQRGVWSPRIMIPSTSLTLWFFFKCYDVQRTILAPKVIRENVCVLHLKVELRGYGWIERLPEELSES